MIGSVVTVVSTVIYVLIAAFVILFALRGYSKGEAKSLAALIRTVAAALLSLGVVRLIAVLLPVNALVGMVTSLVDMEASIYISAAAGLIAAILLCVILPFIFVLLFFIFGLALIYPSRLLAKRFEAAWSDKTAEEKAENGAEEEPITIESAKSPVALKLGGAAIRAIDAILIAALIMLPLSGMLYTLTDGVGGIFTAAEKSGLGASDSSMARSSVSPLQETRELIDEATGPICNNLFVKLSYAGPMKQLYALIGAPKGANISEGNELAQALDFVADAVYLAAPITEYGEEQAEALKRIGSYTSSSYFHSEVTSELVSALSTELLSSPDMAENSFIYMIIAPVLEELATSTPETVSANIESVANIASELISSGVFSEMSSSGGSGDLSSILSDKETMSSTISKFLENETLRGTVTTMVNSSVNALITDLTENTDIDIGKINISFDNLSEDEMKKEADIVADLVTEVQNGTHNTEEGVKKLVGIYLDSAVLTDAIYDASHDESGNVLADPLGIASSFDAEEKADFISVCEEIYTEKTGGGADATVTKNRIVAVAALLGIGESEINF